jgi:hypothetical protein
MNVEVLSVGGKKHVIAESLYKALEVETEKRADWIRNQITRRKLVSGKDWIDSDEGVLFSFEAAMKIYEWINKPETGPRGNLRERSKKRDEYGLPILQQPERRGKLINPYRFDD